MGKIRIHRFFHEAITIVDKRSRPASGFRLLYLPLEIRHLIYHHIYGPDYNNVVPLIEVIFDYTNNLPLEESDASDIHITAHFDRGLINFQLANKQLYNEANPTYYKHLLVMFDSILGPRGGSFHSMGMLHEKFREKLQRITTIQHETNYLELLPGLRGIVHRFCSFGGDVESPEHLLSEFSIQDPDIQSKAHKLVNFVAKKDAQDMSCWFQIEHRAFPSGSERSAPRDYSYTWIHYNPKTKEFDLARRAETINRPSAPRYASSAGRYEISNFPNMGSSPYRYASFNPRLAPLCEEYPCCPCQFYLLQMELKLNVKTVPCPHIPGQVCLERIAPDAHTD